MKTPKFELMETKKFGNTFILTIRINRLFRKSIEKSFVLDKDEKYMFGGLIWHVLPDFVELNRFSKIYKFLESQRLLDHYNIKNIK